MGLEPILTIVFSLIWWIYKYFYLWNTKAVSAKPNQFCQHCNEVLQKLQMHFDGSPQTDYGHTSDIHALSESARNGCHLCSMFVGKITNATQEKWTETPRPLFVRPDQSRKEPCGECTRFDLTLHDAFGQTTHPITLHRHQKTATSRSLQCASIVEKKDDYRDENNLATQLSTGDGATYTAIKKWWQKCQSSHEDCKVAPSSEVGRPTRLLDLKAFEESPDIKLVDGTDTGTDQYVTLSYCWGRINPVMLRTTNIDDFRARIDWLTLPKTMKDAATICRNLGVRYLWIDALCIIQGPDGDFNTEAPRMEAVYAGSTFTIAAAYSEDSDGGCFQDVLPLMRIDSLVSQDSNCTVLLRANKSCLTRDNVPGRCPLDSRGWVYQERMLSPRTLFFGRDEIHWECRKGVVCAYEPDFERPHFPARLQYIPIKQAYIKIRSLETNPLSGNAIQQFRPLWANVIKSYSQTNLSHADDKLAAIAGVASIAQKKLKIEASFGLWLPFLLDELLWEVDLSAPQQQGLGPEPTENEDQVSVSIPVGPSWSWANTRGKTTFIDEPKPGTDRPVSDVEKLYSATLLASPPPTPFIGLHTLMSQRPTPSSVRIRGPFSKCRARPHWINFRICGFNLEPDRPISETERPRSFYLPYNGPHSQLPYYFSNHHNNVIKRRKVACAFQPDLPITKPTDNLVCVLIKRVRYKPCLDPLIVRDVALVLQHTGADSNQYRRVGIYTEERPDWNSPPSFMFQTFTEEEVEIV